MTANNFLSRSFSLHSRLRGMPLIYFVILLIDLVLIMTNFPQGRFISKPLLMVILMWGLYSIRKEMPLYYFITWMGALFFSWVGDVFLMGGEKFFIPGLVGFLIAHLFYIGLFMKWKPPTQLAIRSFIWAVTLTAVFFIYFYQIILLETGNLFGAVLIYAIVILSMWLVAAYRSLRMERRRNDWVLIGAALFVFSDSILGYGKFTDPGVQLGVWVMLTYGLAQFCLFAGIFRMVSRER